MQSRGVRRVTYRARWLACEYVGDGASREERISLFLFAFCSFSAEVGTSFSLSLSLAGMFDVDETLFGNNNYRETCDMSKYSGCRGQRFAHREYTYTSRVIHTLACRRVIVDSQSLQRTYVYARPHETASGPSEAGKRSEVEGTKGGNAVQPLTELDGFEKSWESAVACSRIALEHQIRKERLRRNVGACMCDEVYETITE